MKQLTSNYELQKQSIITGLKNTYSQYLEAITKSLRYTGFNDNGDFFILAGQEKRNAEVKRLEEDLIRLQHQLAIIKDKESADE